VQRGQHGIIDGEYALFDAVAAMGALVFLRMMGN
jgi:hypothetical protein